MDFSDMTGERTVELENYQIETLEDVGVDIGFFRGVLNDRVSGLMEWRFGGKTPQPDWIYRVVTYTKCGVNLGFNNQSVEDVVLNGEVTTDELAALEGYMVWQLLTGNAVRAVEALVKEAKVANIDETDFLEKQTDFLAQMRKTEKANQEITLSSGVTGGALDLAMKARGFMWQQEDDQVPAGYVYAGKQ